jgi:protein SCO1/2
MTRLVLLLPVLALAACQSAAPPAPGGDAPLSDASVYHVDVEWGTDAGETVTLADLRGTPVALAMVYADCGTACPRIVHDMKQIGEAAGVPLRYVLVTLDPERDTPETLRAFRAMHGMGDDWTMLRGTDDDVRTLAAVLGVRYRADPNGTIAHSNLITLLDAGGDVVARQEGLGTDPAPAVAALRTDS